VWAADADSRASADHRKAQAATVPFQPMVLLHEQELQNQAGHGAAVQGDQLSGGERHVAR